MYHLGYIWGHNNAVLWTTKVLEPSHGSNMNLAHLFKKEAVFFLLLLVRFNLESKWEFKNSFQHTQFNQIYGDGLH